MILIDKKAIAQLTEVMALDTMAHGNGWECHIFNAGTASLVDAPAPHPWQAGCWQWDAETWRMVAVPEGYVAWALGRIDTERARRIAKGMPYVFPDGAGTVQLRNEQDIINVTGVGTSGMMMASAGDTSSAVGFRDQEDVTHFLTGQQCMAMAQSVMAWISAHYAAAWALKDAVTTAVDTEDLAALQHFDFSAVWPEAVHEGVSEAEAAA